MGTMRIARTVTGRSKIALFSGSYHGIFDEVIVRGHGKARDCRACAAPGRSWPPRPRTSSSSNTEPDEALAALRAQADDLAAVLVEPVQSRRPELQPREFLHELRRLTEKSGTTLVFDEVITGFRTCPGRGAGILWRPGGSGVLRQGHWWGTAGRRDRWKASVHGCARWGSLGIRRLLRTDGGGDVFCGDLRASSAGACRGESGSHSSEERGGSALQRDTNAKTERLAMDLNAFFEAVGAPLAVRHFGSALESCLHGGIESLG